MTDVTSGASQMAWGRQGRKSCRQGRRTSHRARRRVTFGPGAPAPHNAVVLPVVERRHGRSRPVGAFAIDTEGAVSFVPVVDVQRLAWYAVAGLAGAALTLAAARRRGPSIGSVRMGPGGWVSLKAAAPRRLLPQRRRPWWARLLRAHRLIVE